MLEYLGILFFLQFNLIWIIAHARVSHQYTPVKSVHYINVLNFNNPFFGFSKYGQLKNPVTHSVSGTNGQRITFVPNHLNATISDQVVFRLCLLNHTLTQPTLETPCSSSNQYDSGFNQFNSANRQGLSLTLTVNRLGPQWFLNWSPSADELKHHILRHLTSTYQHIMWPLCPGGSTTNAWALPSLWHPTSGVHLASLANLVSWA